MINHSESAHYSSHFVAATLVSFWLTLYQTSAQSRETAFGQVRFSAVPSKVDHFVLTTKSGEQPVLYAWSARSTTLISAWVDSTGKALDWTDHYLQAPIDEFRIVDFPLERKRFGVGVDRVDRKISFYANLAADTIRPVSVIQLSVIPGNVVFGDLNGDKRTDFVVFDRETPGAIPYFGIGNEKFRMGKVLAPDNAIGGLKLVHLNNDSLLDIVYYDWVRSELHFLYGVGQGKFLDQATSTIDGDVRDFAVTSLTAQGNLDILLACRNPSKLEIRAGDGLGDFQVKQRLNLKDPVVSFLVEDVNGDGYKDIVGVDASSVLHAFLNAGDNTFDEHLDFVGGKDVSQLALYSQGDAALMNALLLDRGAQQMVSLLNGQRPAHVVDSVDLSTGLRPRGIAIADLNGDGERDIAVVTSGSNAVSFFLNGGTSGMYGQVGYSLQAAPHDVVFQSFADSTLHLLISYPDSRQISVFSLDEKERTTTNATIGTERAVELLYWNGLRKPAVDFYTFSPPAPSVQASMTLFQEIGSHHFIEQSFRLHPSSTLLGAGVGRINSDSLPDVAYVYRNNLTGRCELAVSLADSLFTYRQKTFSVELGDGNVMRSYVWVVDLDRKGHPDIVLLTVGPTPLLERLRWLKEGSFARSDTIARDLHIADDTQVKFVDVDGDGLIDIVVNDRDRGEIGWMRAKGTAFEPFRRLCSAPARTHYSLGDLNGDGISDLAATLSDSGILRIYDGKTLVRKSFETGR